MLFFDMMWKNIVEPDRSQIIIWRMGLACCTTKTTDTLCQYVILTAFVRKMFTRTSLNFTLYVHCLHCFKHTVIVSLYGIHPLAFVREGHCVFRKVRTEMFHIMWFSFSLQRPCYGPGGFSPRKPTFYSGLDSVRFTVDKTALWQVSLREIPSFSVSLTPIRILIYLHLHSSLIGWTKAEAWEP